MSGVSPSLPLMLTSISGCASNVLKHCSEEFVDLKHKLSGLSPDLGSRLFTLTLGTPYLAQIGAVKRIQKKIHFSFVGLPLNQFIFILRQTEALVSFFLLLLTLLASRCLGLLLC